MEVSILIAKIMAIVYLSFGIGLLFNTAYYKKGIEELLDNTGYMILGGLYAIIGGLLIIEFHNNWVKNWTLIITLFGWIALIKGILLLTFPKAMVFFKPMFQYDNLYKYLAPLILIFGLAFAYLGFFIN